MAYDFKEEFKKNIKECIEKYKADKNRDKRIENNSCKKCYYLDNNLSGQGFTKSLCHYCGIEMIRCNADVNYICVDCASERNKCCHCGESTGEINLSQWEKDQLKGCSE